MARSPLQIYEADNPGTTLANFRQEPVGVVADYKTRAAKETFEIALSNLEHLGSHEGADDAEAQLLKSCLSYANLVSNCPKESRHPDEFVASIRRAARFVSDGEMPSNIQDIVSLIRKKEASIRKRRRDALPTGDSEQKQKRTRRPPPSINDVVVVAEPKQRKRKDASLKVQKVVTSKSKVVDAPAIDVKPSGAVDPQKRGNAAK